LYTINTSDDHPLKRDTSFSENFSSSESKEELKNSKVAFFRCGKRDPIARTESASLSGIGKLSLSIKGKSEMDKN